MQFSDVKHLTRHLAKLSVRNVFEDIHAGKLLPEEFRSNEYSRITDSEMRALMLEVESSMFNMLGVYIKLLEGKRVTIAGRELDLKEFLDALNIVYKDGVSWDDKNVARLIKERKELELK